jgi:hypothetical protein
MTVHHREVKKRYEIGFLVTKGQVGGRFVEVSGISVGLSQSIVEVEILRRGPYAAQGNPEDRPVPVVDGCNDPLAEPEQAARRLLSKRELHRGEPGRREQCVALMVEPR